MNSKQIEVAIAQHFDSRRHIMAPNIHWGLNIHECDMFILRPSGFCVEVEIKISLADLKKDKTKKHNHENDLISELYFAIPKSMEKHIQHIPIHAGIILVEETENGYLRTTRERIAKKNKNARKITQDEIYTLSRLSLIRYWNLRASENHNAGVKRMFEDFVSFSKKTYKAATSDSTMIKTVGELKEVEQELQKIKTSESWQQFTNKMNLSEEIVDVMMCLLSLADKNQISVSTLLNTFRSKLHKNKNSKWVKNKDNTYSRIKQ